MASIKQSLKKVYKALSGGTDSSSKSISGIIDDISTVASSGGGGSSSAGMIVYTIGYDDEDESYYWINGPTNGYQSIVSDIQNNKLVALKYFEYYYYPHLLDSNLVEFGTLYTINGTNHLSSFYVSSSNNISYTEKQI